MNFDHTTTTCWVNLVQSCDLQHVVVTYVTCKLFSINSNLLHILVQSRSIIHIPIVENTYKQKKIV